MRVVDLEDECKLICQIDKPRTSYLKFSPLGSYLTVWETFHISNSKDSSEKKEISNLNIYEIKPGTIFKSTCQKKQMEKFIHWSNDESLFACMGSNEILFFEKSNPGFKIEFFWEIL